MVSLGLCVISKTAKEVEKIVKDYSKYFDKLYIQINGGGHVPNNHDNVEYSTFKWVDDFSEARNTLLKEVKTDFWAWIDTDDTIDKPELMKGLAQTCEDNNLDGIYLAYDYQRNQFGELEAYQWRERILRTSHPWTWIGVIHETPVSRSEPQCSKNTEIVIKHKLKTEDDIRKSAERNHKYLLKEYAKKDKDPRIVFYLGGSYMWFQQDEKAIETYLEYIRMSGWEEEKYRAWCNIALLHLRNKSYDKCKSACYAAIDILPSWPEAWFTLSQAWYMLEDHEKCLEMLKVGLSKPEPDTISITSPSKRIIAMVTGAMSELTLGRPKEAKELYDMALELSPTNPEVTRYKDLIYYSFDEQLATEAIRDIISYYAGTNGNIVKLFESLPPNLRADPRLRPARVKYLPSKKWADKSIVFYCAPTAEVWGPDTLKDGMGGSEEAIVYLTRELAKLGYEVAVYNERDEVYVDHVEHGTDFEDGELKEVDTVVTYYPLSLHNPNDEYSHFVVWRAPEAVKLAKAKHKYVDLHDTIQPDRLYQVADEVDKFFVKSNYHRSLYPGLPDKKFAVVSNGIVREQFE